MFKYGWLQNPVMTKGFDPEMHQDRDTDRFSSRNRLNS